MRHPFPGPGLAIRILGEITPDQVRIAQHADAIFIEEIRKAGIYDQMSQAFCALLPVKAVGVQGDRRTYEQVICVRAVKTEDFMTAEWFDFPPAVLRKLSNRITNEVNGIVRPRPSLSLSLSSLSCPRWHGLTSASRTRRTASLWTSRPSRPAPLSGSEAVRALV